MRFEPRNPKLWQFEDLKLLSSATWWSKFETNTLVEISKEFSTRILNFIVFEEQKNFNPQPTQFLKKNLKNHCSQTMLLSMLDILTHFILNFSETSLSYLLFRFEIALLRHHVTNFEKIFDTIQDFLISPILKKSLAKSVKAILRYQLNKPQEGGVTLRKI